ncbi:MAG: VOC family protein [Chloroflexi bacterium]|nr:VOC family protein [Chloroflexota bacterium]
MRITCVTVDCRSPAALARFWGEALRWETVTVSDSGNGATCRPPDGGAYMEFVRVPEEKIGKNRLHLGCNAGTLADLELELSRLKALGATVAREEEFPPEIAIRYRNVILRDIEGNEFCLGAGNSPA